MENSEAINTTPLEACPVDIQHRLDILSTHVSINKGITNPRFLNKERLKRFLAARDFDVQKAIRMFDDYWLFREESKIDRVIEEDWTGIAILKNLYPRAFFYTDREGKPVLIVKLGQVKFSEIFKHFDLKYIERTLHLHYELMERVILPSCSKSEGREITQFTVILDLKGFSLKNMCSSNVMNMMKTASKVVENYFPQIVGKTFAINVPIMYYGAYKLVKPFLSKRTQSQLVILGSSYLTALLKLIPIENIPSEYGGKCPQIYDGNDHGGYVQDLELCKRLKRWDLKDNDTK